MMIQILLVDNHETLRRSLKTELETRTDLQVVGQVENGKRALEQLKTFPLPDVVLIHIHHPVIDEVETMQHLIKQFPQLKILVLDSFNDPQFVKQTLCLGVKGYLAEDMPIAELVKVIQFIHKGYSYFGSGILEALLAKMATREHRHPANPSSATVSELMKLTERERSVLKLLAQGANNREIAQTLSLTEGTVRNYISNILGRLNVRDRTQAAILMNTFGSVIEISHLSFPDKELQRR